MNVNIVSLSLSIGSGGARGVVREKTGEKRRLKGTRASKTDAAVKTNSSGVDFFPQFTGVINPVYKVDNLWKPTSS